MSQPGFPKGVMPPLRDAAEGPARRPRHVPDRVQQRREVTTTVEHARSSRRLAEGQGIRHYLLGAGWLRAAWMMCLFWGSALGIVLVFRWWAGWDPLFKWSVITTVATLTAAPIGFLAGLGGFDYWSRCAIGSPTEPEDHSTHGGRTLEGLLPARTPTTR